MIVCIFPLGSMAENNGGSKTLCAVSPVASPRHILYILPNISHVTPHTLNTAKDPGSLCFHHMLLTGDSTQVQTSVSSVVLPFPLLPIFLTSSHVFPPAC